MHTSNRRKPPIVSRRIKLGSTCTPGNRCKYQ